MYTTSYIHLYQPVTDTTDIYHIAYKYHNIVIPYMILTSYNLHKRIKNDNK